MSNVFLMHGLPGSGKSYLALQIADELRTVYSILSTDNYWNRPDGRYDWNPKLLKEAHEWNQKQFGYTLINALWNDRDIIVDNTNITNKECQPYIESAIAKQYKVWLVEPNTTWQFNAEECALRNSHEVPLESIRRMLYKWETSESIAAKYNQDIKIARGLDELIQKLRSTENLQ